MPSKTAEQPGHCKTCSLWDPGDPGICRRYPPQVVPIDATAGITLTMWPETDKDDWCGEWVKWEE
jgi:hypothetical protein